MPYKNPEDQKAYHAQWYLKNSDRIIEKSRKSSIEYIQRNKQFVRSYKSSNPCVDCGGLFHFSAMDFDHTKDGKKDTIARLVNQAFSIKTILKEIALCELVCSNCHRVRTWKRLQVDVAE